MVSEGDLPLDCEHTMHHTGHVSHKCILESFVILLTIITPIRLIIKTSTEDSGVVLIGQK